jgi:hypothetical protein
MTEQFEVPNEIKKEIIKGLMQEVNVAIFRMTCVHAANKKVGAPPDQLKTIVDELTRLEGLKMAYEEELKNINKEANK